MRLEYAIMTAGYRGVRGGRMAPDCVASRTRRERNEVGITRVDSPAGRKSGEGGMKIFVDSANLVEIEEAVRRGFQAGITTNPSIMSKEDRTDFKLHIKRIIKLCERYDRKIPLSVEVFTADPKAMVKQATEFVAEFGEYEGLNVKVPIGWDELAGIRDLKTRGIRVNCTSCLSFHQALMASAARADFLSVFFSRVREIALNTRSV